MNWLNGQIIRWQDPLSFTAKISDHDLTLLYSGMRDQESGDVSYLFVDPITVIEDENWPTLCELADDNREADLPDWVGYFGYGLRAASMRGASSILDFPNARFVRYKYLFCFDHQAKKITSYRREGMPSFPMAKVDLQASALPTIQSLHSNMTRHEYETCIAGTIARIHAGDFYQANITRKFFGEFSESPDSFALFQALCAASPAPYSAYIRHEDSAILSASPECFLSITDEQISARPIKGSAPRAADATADKAAQEVLVASDKNQAENLMIVDLMRNDLSQVSVPGSVQVTAQSELHTYQTIHHLISHVTGKKRPDCSMMEVIRACFPPGSMTGAPKIAAVDWCCEQEKIERGIYSGAVGWLNRAGCDLSVVIRTLLIQGNRFEFQVGGGIVADSIPEEEWQETLAKARGILTALGLTEADIARL